MSDSSRAARCFPRRRAEAAPLNLVVGALAHPVCRIFSVLDVQRSASDGVSCTRLDRRGTSACGERKEQQRFASEHRLHQTAVIKEKGPELMRRLVTGVGAAVDELILSARVSSSEIGFEPLPGEGFWVTKVEFASVSRERRPDYK